MHIIKPNKNIVCAVKEESKSYEGSVYTILQPRLQPFKTYFCFSAGKSVRKANNNNNNNNNNNKACMRTADEKA